MSDAESSTDPTIFTGGCLCGALRYEASGKPMAAGVCFCVDCQKASGSGFIPFLLIAATDIRITGEVRQWESPAAKGGVALRNFCAVCNSLVFGGPRGETDSHTIYAGSLDDKRLFKPTIALFNSTRPAWVPLPADLKVFERMPP